MARGKPDWSPNNPRSVLSSVDDLAASIVALGGNAGFNRDGFAIISDNFGDGLTPYVTANSGTGSSVALDTTVSFSGVQSVKLTSGSDSSRTASLRKFVTYISDGLLRFEVFISAFQDIASILLSLSVTRDGFRNIASMGLDFDLGNVLRITTGEANVDVGDFDWADNGEPFWHVISIAINANTLEFEDFRLDDIVLDQSNIAIGSASTTDENTIDAFISVSSIAAENGIINIDNIRLSVL